MKLFVPIFLLLAAIIGATMEDSDGLAVTFVGAPD